MKSPENFNSIRVSVQTQIKFEVWKPVVIIIIIFYFAGQKYADQKIVEIPNFFDGSWKRMPKMS